MINPFNKSIHLQFSKIALSEALFYGLGFDCRSRRYVYEPYFNTNIKQGSDNPYLLDNNGNKQYYQRELVWDLENKVALLDSIYSGLDIGKFVIIRRSDKYIKSQLDAGNTDVSFHELVDGKQRLNCIAEFILDGFKDSNGMLYSQYDDDVKRKIYMYANLACATIDEPSPKEIQQLFLSVNYTGKPMSKEHIEYVRYLNI